MRTPEPQASVFYISQVFFTTGVLYALYRVIMSEIRTTFNSTTRLHPRSANSLAFGGKKRDPGNEVDSSTWRIYLAYKLRGYFIPCRLTYNMEFEKVSYLAIRNQL